jgi:pimeloyl-ACP methyl ester carboxylesterase
MRMRRGSRVTANGRDVDRCVFATVNAADVGYRVASRSRMLRPMNSSTRRSSTALAGSLLLALGAACQKPPTINTDSKRPTMKISETGNGSNILVLHGGGGPATMTSLVAHLAPHAHVITPTHPGWDGTPRPDSLTSVAALADEYVRYLDDHDARDVLVIGSSLGGWLGAEIALRDTHHRVTGLVIINGVGVDIPGHPITDISHFTPPEIAKVAYHDPAKFGAGAPPMTPERMAIMRSNQAALAVFAGDPYCYDPTLLGRLHGIHVPTLVLWGASDHVVTKDYGRAYAEAIPNATFETVAAAGHLPWLEQPADTFSALDRFLPLTTASSAR